MNNVDNPQSKNRRSRVNILRQLWVIFGTGAIIATLFNAWTPLGLIPLGLGEQISQIFSPPENSSSNVFPTPTQRPKPRIGIVSGHWGFDSGAICPDGLTEFQVNLEVATKVKEQLTAEGFDIDILEEKDARLNGYKALALVSIHSDTCEFINNSATGFKVAAALANSRPNRTSRLVACLTSRYYESTNLEFHAGSITEDMTSYHAFNEIHSDTVAAIIEIGFMNLDRQILTTDPDRVAQGITNGVLCFIRNEEALPPS